MDTNKPVFKLFPKSADRVKIGLCAYCGKTVRLEDFRDTLSYKEFGISGLCQRCQDEIFGR